MKYPIAIPPRLQNKKILQEPERGSKKELLLEPEEMQEGIRDLPRGSSLRGLPDSHYIQKLPSQTFAKDPPVVLYLRRQSVRQFPNGQKVALYYAPTIDKHISIPYGAGNDITAIPEEIKISEDKLQNYMGTIGATKSVSEEQLNELSPKTLTSYLGSAIKKPITPTRQKGISTAMKKLNWEETLDEVSKKPKSGILRTIKKLTKEAIEEMNDHTPLHYNYHLGYGHGKAGQKRQVPDGSPAGSQEHYAYHHGYADGMFDRSHENKPKISEERLLEGHKVLGHFSDVPNMEIHAVSNKSPSGIRRTDIMLKHKYNTNRYSQNYIKPVPLKRGVDPKWSHKQMIDHLKSVHGDKFKKSGGVTWHDDISEEITEATKIKLKKKPQGKIKEFKPKHVLHHVEHIMKEGKADRVWHLDGTSTKVDVPTAHAIMGLYQSGTVDGDNKAKIHKMVNKNRINFLKVASFAHGYHTSRGDTNGKQNSK